jgi:hypothetical protein
LPQRTCLAVFFEHQFSHLLFHAYTCLI